MTIIMKTILHLINYFVLKQKIKPIFKYYD